MRVLILSILALMCFNSVKAQSLVRENRSENAIKADKEWQPTGEWPFLLRRFETATIITGFINKKKTIYPCNIHIGKQTLMYMLDDQMMEADPYNVNSVEFINGDKYISIGNSFAKVIREDSIGKVVLVKLVDYDKMKEDENDVSHKGAVTIEGDFGSLSLDFINQYVANPEELPLPVKDTYFFIYDKDIFQVTDKNVIAHINPARKKEYKAFTRSAEIISTNESSVLKIWDEFFIKY